MHLILCANSIAKIIAMPQVIAFLIIDSEDKSRLFKLTKDEPVIIEYIMKNTITNESINNADPFFCLISMDRILLNLSGITDSIWKIKVTANKIIVIVELLNPTALK